MKQGTFIYAAALIAVVAITPAKADVLASFTLTGSMRSSQDTDPNSTASMITDGIGFVSLVNSTIGNPAPALTVDYAQIDGTSNATAFAANDYFTFTLTPTSGFALNLSSIAFDYANYSTDTTFSPASFFVRSSVNGYASNVGSTASVAAGSNGAFSNFSFNLGAAYQNLAAPVEFRIYLQESTANASTTRGAAVDNVFLNGTVTSVPEPSTAVALAGSLGLLCCFHRMRRGLV